MRKEIKEHSEWSLQRLGRMYFAMHCWKCMKFELPIEEYKRLCEDNIQKIIDNMKESGIEEMKFKEFNSIIKSTEFCKFEPRDFTNNCPIYKKWKIV